MSHDDSSGMPPAGRRELSRIASHLASSVSGPVLDYVPGKTAFRDEVIALLGCSTAEAEDLVDHLEAAGYLSYEGDPRATQTRRGRWTVHPIPSS